MLASALGSGGVRITHAPPDRVILSWSASPQADMVADSCVAVIAQVGLSTITLAATSRPCCGGGGGGGVDSSEHSHHDHHHHHHQQHKHQHHDGKCGSTCGGGGGEAPSAASPAPGETPAGGLPAKQPLLLESEAWARATLTSDAGPLGALSGSAIERRRRELGRLLGQQYGGGVSEGPSEEGKFSLAVQLDDACARIVYSAAEESGDGSFAVSLEGAGTQEPAVLEKWVESLKRTCSIADSLCLPVILGVPSSVKG